MENPFAKLVKEGEELSSENKRLQELEERLDNLRAWQNDWTPEDRDLATQLEGEISQLKGDSEE